MLRLMVMRHSGFHGVMIDLDASGEMLGMKVLDVRLRGIGTTLAASLIAAE